MPRAGRDVDLIVMIDRCRNIGDGLCHDNVDVYSTSRGTCSDARDVAKWNRSN